MIFNIAICDDDVCAVETLNSYLYKIRLEMDIDFQITSFYDSQKLLTAYTAPSAFHLLFLDVEMPGLDGIELAKKIRALPDRNVRIIFVSSYPQYMKDSFNVQAFQYLTKPYSYKELQEIVIQIIDDYKNSQIAKLLVHTDYSEELVNLNDIISVESINAKQKVLLVTTKEKTIEATGLIGDWEKDLAEQGFISPCRGFLINIQHLHYFRKNDVIMSNNTAIPLSRRKEKNVRTLFNKNLLIHSMTR